MVKSGFLFLGIFLGLALLCSIPQNIFSRTLAFLMLLLGAFVVFFFRDPVRRVIADPSLLYSPADGRVMSCDIEDHPYLGRCRVVKIFLSVFNVHLQRAPMDGVVEKTERKGGLFLAAYKPDASKLNVQNMIVISDDKVKIGVVQITGLIARRIECWVNEKQSLKQGDKIGFIRFGSQVDLYFPEQFDAVVKPGDCVRAGITAIGRKK